MGAMRFTEGDIPGTIHIPFHTQAAILQVNVVTSFLNSGSCNQTVFKITMQIQISYVNFMKILSKYQQWHIINLYLPSGFFIPIPGSSSRSWGSEELPVSLKYISSPFTSVYPLKFIWILSVYNTNIPVIFSKIQYDSFLLIFSHFLHCIRFKLKYQLSTHTFWQEQYWTHSLLSISTVLIPSAKAVYLQRPP